MSKGQIPERFLSRDSLLEHLVSVHLWDIRKDFRRWSGIDELLKVHYEFHKDKEVSRKEET